MRHPFKWGLRSDCTAACEAFRSLHGIDPAEGCEERYSTALGGARKLRKYGGYLGWCRFQFDLPETTDPQAGDLVLISSAGMFGAALAICIQPGEYASKTEHGMVITRADILGAWTCPF